MEQVALDHDVEILPIRSVEDITVGEVCLVKEDGSFWEACRFEKDGLVRLTDSRQVTDVGTSYRVVRKDRFRSIGWRDFLRTWQKEGRLVTQLVWGTILLNLSAIVIPLYMNAMYGRILPAQAEASLWVLSIGAALAFFLDFLVRRQRSGLMAFMVKTLEVRVEPGLIDTLVETPARADTGWGTATTAALQAWSRIKGGLFGLASSSAIDIAFCVFYFCVMAVVSGWLVVVAMTVWALQVAAVFYFDRKLASIGKLDGAVRQLDHPLPFLTYVSLGAQDWLRRSFLKSIERTSETEALRYGIQMRVYAILITLTSLQTVLLVVAGFYLLASGAIGAGALFAAIMLGGRVNQPVFSLVGALPTLRQMRENIALVNSALSSHSQSIEPGSELLRDESKGWQLDRLTFGYAAERSVLNGLNLHIKKGERVAIVGEAVSGKSTLAKVLSGVMVADGVTWAGAPFMAQASSFRAEKLHFSPQDAPFVGNSLLEFLSLEGNISLDRCAEVLRDLELMWLEPLLSRGLMTRWSDPDRLLPPARRQMLALLRLCLSRRSVFILDEPTAHLNAAEEARFVTILKAKLIPSDTLVICTDRGSLLSLVDRVIVLKGGAVVFDGSTACFSKTRVSTTSTALEGGDQ